METTTKDWIDLNEKLPKLKQNVLIYLNKFNRIYIGSLDSVLGSPAFKLSDRFVSIRNVSHWQPLPEPPKGE